MSHVYTVNGYDENGENVLEVDVTLEQILPLLSSHIQALKAQIETLKQPVEEDTPPPGKRAYTKREKKEMITKSPRVRKACCGSMSRHLKTCTVLTQGKATDPRPTLPGIADEDQEDQPKEEETNTLGENVFNLVHERFLELQETRAVADELDLPLKEVNRAMGFTKYWTYVEKREGI